MTRLPPCQLSRKKFNETKVNDHGLNDDQVKLIMLINGIKAAQEIGPWKDRWVMHRLPTQGGSREVQLFLTDMGDYDESSSMDDTSMTLGSQ